MLPDSAAPRPPTLPIDHAFDTAFADEMARLESYNKHHYRPNTYLHKWWARRCGSTFRLILKHLVQDEAQRDYYAPGGLEGKVILDPMMGGGTTLHEAIRMGASVVGVDVDPIPVLQARATLADVPLVALEQAYRAFYEGLVKAVGPAFETTCPQCEPALTGALPARYLLYGSRRVCGCGPVLLVDSLVLRYENGQPAVWLCPFCARPARHDAPCDCDGQETQPFRVVQRARRCERCGQRYQEDKTAPFYTRYDPLVVVGQCKQHGLFFKAPAGPELAQLAAADARRSELELGPLEAFIAPAGPKSRDLRARGVRSFLELFTSRQLLYLHEARRLLAEMEPAVRLNLALLVSTSLEFNSLLCGYKGARKGDRPGAIRHTFSYHAYTFPYLALENNPLYPRRASGTLHKLFHDRIRRARTWAARPRERQLNGPERFTHLDGERDGGQEVDAVEALRAGPRRFLLHQGSAVDLPLPDHSVDFVVTDPPYFDSVQYGDLAAFFRPWLAQLVPAGARWHYDLATTAVDPKASSAANTAGAPSNGQYAQVLGQVFSECARVLRPKSGRLVFTFHHWNPLGWAALTMALAGAGFRLQNRYVVHSENPVSVHIANMRALTHDAILVLVPAGTTPPVQWERPAQVGNPEAPAGEASRQFCFDCATLLGWLLEQNPDKATILRTWQQALS